MSVTALNRGVDRCILRNPVFTRLAEGTFRRSETDGTPVLMVPLGEGMASVPLRSLQREFGIDDDSDDGRMLSLIAESLEFVSSISIGDTLPSEVLTGNASWQPSPRHYQTAAAKIRMQLISWIDPKTMGLEGQAPSLERLETDPVLRASVQRAFERVAEELKLPDVQAVTQLVGDIANELAFIEALRDRFLRRVQSMCQRIAAIAKGVVSQDRKMLLTRIDRLATLALDQIAGRFGLVDAQTGEVLSTLRNAAVHSGYIRSHRDWLYKSSRAWETILAEWDASAMPGLDDATWARLNRTYHFLAPRFMPVQEWFSAEMQAKARQKQNTPGRTWMVW